MHPGLDLVEKEKLARAQLGVWRALRRHFLAFGLALAASAAMYAAYVCGGLVTGAQTAGAISRMPVHASLQIARDDRGVPHIRAADEHDLFFAEGFVQGSDRLFQMDLIRRYIYGRLSEIVGAIQLENDERMRLLDVREIAERQWRELPPSRRAMLQSFSDGVNAAMRSQPLPVEFRLLLYRPDPWRPQDCLAVTLAISASLADSPHNVLQRDTLWRSMKHADFDRILPLSDPAYDVSISGEPARRRIAFAPVAWPQSVSLQFNRTGSNAWASGARHTQSGRALLANDPHLDLGIPGIWYVVDLSAPGWHVAGVTIPGLPGVVLGHNDRIAWGTTNATASSLSVFAAPKLQPEYWKRESFRVRFGGIVTHAYYRTPREFGVPDDAHGGRLVMVRWAPYRDARSAFETIVDLDRASNVRQALHAIAGYAGPAQNFIVADSHGAVAYHLAGPVRDDPAWGRYVHPARDLARDFPRIPFAKLPAVPGSRSAILVSANNKMYGDAYPYRLSAMFAPPYRAYRIAQLLHARGVYDAAYFAWMQLDAVSPIDAEYAHRLAAYARRHADVLPRSAIRDLALWDGTYSPESRAATIEHDARTAADGVSPSPYFTFNAMRLAQPPEAYMHAIQDGLFGLSVRTQPWSRAGAVTVFHPFGPIGFPFLNGRTLPGDGDEYTIRVQTAGFSQSFRAVWDVGRWDEGGLSIPSGESGEIGSRHYDDLSDAWTRGVLQPLPFSSNAVRAATRERLVLTR